MKEEILVTVITLSYNSFDTIKETVDSVLNQSYGNFQYIISDDGSELFDEDYLKEYIDKNNSGNIKEVRIIHHCKNIGTVRNLNNALKYVKGEIVFYISADDCFYDNFVLSDWVNEFTRTKGEVITARRAVYDKDLQECMHYLPTDLQIKAVKQLSSEELLEELAPKNFIFGCCTAMRTKIFKEYGYYNDKYRYIEDYAFNLKLLRNGQKIGFFDRIVIKYRTSGVSSVTKLNRRYFRENYAIFKREALPFVIDKRLTKKRYNTWVIGVKTDIKKERIASLCRNKGNVLRRIKDGFTYKVLLGIEIGFRKLIRNPHIILRIFNRNKVMNIKKINFQQHGDSRGNLVVAEIGKELPFVVKRIYYVYGVDKSQRRGFHAHKNLEQVMICIAGSCKLMFTDGEAKTEIELKNPYEAVYVGSDIWREMYDFSPDAVLLVLASDVYNEADYIRDYDEFLSYVKK